MHGADMENACLPHLSDLMPKRKALTPTESEFLEPAEVFLWAEQLDYSCYFTGKWKRMWKVEKYLPRLVEKGYLRTAKMGRKYVYTLNSKPNKDTHAVKHGLMCTKALLNFKVSRPGQFISERFFREIRLGVVPEFAGVYEKSVVLFEYSTANNFGRPSTMRKKVKQYSEGLSRIENYFGKQAIVLFVFEAPRHRVKNFVTKYGRHSSFYFCDLNSFIDAPYGEHLISPIYIWGHDQKEYPLE